MPAGYVFLYSFIIPYHNRGGYVWVIYTYRRGVCVARFDELGNAKASKGETSNRYRFSRFSFYIKVHITAESGELIGKLKEY